MGEKGAMARDKTQYPSGDRTRQLSKAALIVVAILLLVLPMLLPGQKWIRVLDHAALYTMMALGLNLLAGQTGLVSLGYVAFFGVGAYTYALLASSQADVHMPFILLFPMAGILAGLLGLLLAIPTLGLKGDYLAMVTMAFSEILRILLHNLKGITGGTQGVLGIDKPDLIFCRLSTSTHYYYFLLAVCAVVIASMRRLQDSKIGRAWAATREDEGAARTSGLDTKRLKLLACAIGSIPAGLAGALFAPMQTYISPENFVVDESIAILAMVVVGGIGSIPGVVLGAVLLTVLPEPLRTYAQTYRLLIYGAILIAFTLFRPQGIWPKRGR